MSFLFDLDHWHEIQAALLRNRVRTTLTAFGVFWGIFLLMIMLGSGSGLRNGVMREYAGSATNSFFVWTQRTQKPYQGMPAGRNLEMDNSDVDAVRERIQDIETLAPQNQLGGYMGGNNVARGRHAGAFSVMGEYPEIRRIQSYRILAGRFLDRLDLEENRKIAVIGPKVRDVLFPGGEDPIGKSITVNGVYFSVIGVFESGRSSEDADRDAQSLLVPFTTFQRAFNYGNRVGWIAATSKPDVPASKAEQRVLELLKERHKVDPTDLRAFGHYNVEEDYNKIRGLFQGISILVWLVGAGTLAAGAIGVSNIMLIIIKERTKEIGIRRAVGAQPSAVVAQILFEAVFLTSIAGYLGMVAGIGLVEAVNRMLPHASTVRMFANPDVGLGQALQALAILIFAGLLAGLAPAQRALQISPITALRSE